MDHNQGKFLSRRDVIVLLLLALPLLVTVSTIEAAHWVRGLPSLKVLVLVSLVMWAFLARSRVPWWVGHPVAILVGLVIAFVLSAFTLTDTNGLGDLGNRLGTWFGAIGTTEGNRGAAMTGMLLIGLTLWMGYATVWLAYRRSYSLLAALPGLGVLLVVLTFLPTDFYWYFFMYLLAAAPGIAYRHDGRWSMRGQRVPMLGTLVAGLLLMAVTLAPVSQAPAPEGTVLPLVSKLEKPWYAFTDRWSNLFHGVPNRKDWGFFSPPIDLPFKGPVDPQDDILFVVESEKPYRWRMRVYDTYVGSGNGAGWGAELAPVKATMEDAPFQEHMEEFKDRDNMKIDVRLYSKSNTLVFVGEPLKTGIPSKAELSAEPAFRLYLDSPQVSYLPPEVSEYRDRLVAWLDATGDDTPLEDKQIPLQLIPKGRQSAEPSSNQLRDSGFSIARVTKYAADESGTRQGQPDTPYLAAERIEKTSGPRMALLSTRILVPPRQYSTVGSISTAEPNMLRDAGQDYPNWVTDRYIQLPNDFPETVRSLARELTKDQDNPYDMAEAIRRSLINLPYSLDFVAPPEGRDWVEHFLLVNRRGYCQNYASAMITMLRSLGIPSRLVTGFAPGEWNEQRKVWEVTFEEYHAWPEVYFPGYGWVEFEPTPADVQPALEALGIQPQAQQQGFSIGDDPCDDPSGLLVGCLPESEAGSGDVDPFDVPDEESSSFVAAGDPGNEGLGYSFLLWTFLALGVAVALVAPVGAVSYIRRGILRLGYPTVTYASMCILGRLGGVALRPQHTPWEYSARLRQAFPEHDEAINRVTKGFVTTRYGPSKELDGEQTEDVRASWLSIRRTLLGRIFARPFRRRG